MFQAKITTSGTVAARLAHLQAQLNDLKPLGQGLAQIVEKGNQEGILAGLDASGQAMPPDKDGRTPLIPHGTASRVIRDFHATAVPKSDGVEIDAGWDGDTSFLQFYGPGSKRNVLGIRPKTLQECLDFTSDYVKGLLT